MIQSKSNAILNKRRFYKLTTVFRFMEMCFFLVIISRFSSQLPSTVKVTGDYLKSSNFTSISPKFVFVIGNLIILILFFKSRVVENIENVDLCNEYVKSCDQSVVSTVANVVVVVDSNKRKISRSRSEKMMSVRCRDERTHRELKRSVTEMRKCKRFGDGDALAETSRVKDELSCDDFRRTVEAFIARQQKMLRDEELLPMV
ncbi:hypothetical protein QVD17_14427 [Tagetes erecta]|uniref:DUF4408 domain-containing protein n=1 Tax=Tagetes erecta TaxID=13708 RepID=A0AAD8L163_TARER|nr:hypothetical protein QVD17_14427 [Tagetes erecta]